MTFSNCKKSNIILENIEKRQLWVRPMGGWNSTLQAAWYVRHAHWARLCYVPFVIWWLWITSTTYCWYSVPQVSLLFNPTWYDDRPPTYIPTIYFDFVRCAVLKPFPAAMRAHKPSQAVLRHQTWYQVDVVVIQHLQRLARTSWFCCRCTVNWLMYLKLAGNQWYTVVWHFEN